MRFLSICSGIEAASVAWKPLGWKAQGFAEIDAFPSAVLAHHYPDVPNLGDMTRFQEWPDLAVDLVCGGTPCQAFSVAGLRAGLADPRGNLALTFLGIVDRYRPRWVVWENVPGVLSSNGGRDFGAFVGGLGQLGYGWAYRVLDAQWCRVDGFPRAVPQRRRRVFVVGYLGDWRRAAAVLFEPESVLGDTPPRRQAGEGSAADTAPCLTSSGRGVERTGETRGQDPVVAVPPPTYTLAIRGRGDSHELEFRTDGTANALLTPNGGRAGIGVGAIAAPTWPATVAPTLDAHFGDKMGLEDQHINSGAGLFVAHTLKAEGFDASEDGTGRGTPIVPVAFQTRGSNIDTNGAISGTLGTNGDRASGGAPMVAAPVAFDAVQITSKANRSIPQPVSPTMAKASSLHAVTGYAVRRLTPRECERLQGFPEIRRSVTVYVCAEEKIASASSAAHASQAQNHGASAPVVAHVQIDLERSAVEIHKAGRSLCSVSGAAAPNSFLHPMPLDAFVRLAAAMTTAAVPTTPTGEAAARVSISGSSLHWNGNAFVSVSGRVIDELVSDVGKFTDAVNRCMRSTTSPSGPSSQNCDLTLATFASCAVAAISSCIPEQTRQASSYAVTIETVEGYTLIPYRGKPAADGPRYKALGNSWAVNVARWVGRRIEMVEAITAEMMEAAE